MSRIDELLDQVKSQIVDHVQRGGHKDFDTDGLLGRITDIFGAHKRAASTGGRDVRPASEDPYGDPADQMAGRSVKPASQDPYGDPADEERRRR
jgi:hypothetical protein